MSERAPVSDFLHETLKSAISGAILIVLALLAFYLLSAFTLRIFAVTAVFLAAGTAAAVAAFRFWRRGRRAVAVVAAAAAGVTVFLAVAWIAVGPFFLAPKPLYVFVSDEISGSALWADSTRSSLSRVTPLLGSEPSAGTMMVATDALRAWCARALARTGWGPIHLLSPTRFGDTTYVVLPLSTAIRSSERGTSLATGKRKLYLAALGPIVSFQARDDADGNPDVRFGYGRSDPAPSLIIERQRRKGLAPVEAIPLLPSSPPETTLLYAARVDAALTAASLGDRPKAFGLLDAAASDPPGDAGEQVRVLVLLGSLASFYVRGTAGELQSLPYFVEAAAIIKERADEWEAASRLRPALYEYLLEELRAGFSSVQRAFPEQTRLLGIRETAPARIANPSVGAMMGEIRDDARDASGTSEDDVIRCRLRQMTADEFENHARTMRGGSVEEKVLFLGRAEARSRCALDDATESRRIEDAMIAVARSCPEPWRTAYVETIRMSSWLRTTMLAGASPFTPSIIHGLLQSGSGNRKDSFPRTSGILMRMFANGDIQKKPVLSVPSHPQPGIAWWDQRFLDWYIARGISLTLDIDEKPSPEQLVNDVFFAMIRDGRGQIFLPGVYFVLYVADDADHPELDRLRRLFRETTGADFASIRTAVGTTPREIWADKVEIPPRAATGECPCAPLRTTNR